MNEKEKSINNEKDEFDLQAELVKKRAEIHSFDDLVKFLKDVEDNYNCGYGGAPRAIAQASLAVAWHLADVFGITGFQAGCTMWDFIRDWSYRGNQCGLKIVDYDNMLYPQYAHKYEKTISKEVWEALQKQAKENLKDHTHAHPDVIAHWKSIAEGYIPFGYKLSRD
jgi:hypothetical protein